MANADGAPGGRKRAGREVQRVYYTLLWLRDKTAHTLLSTIAEQQGFPKREREVD